MRRLTVLALCAVVAFAFSALAATGAQAKKSEHGELVLESKGGPASLMIEANTVTSSSNEGEIHIQTATSGSAEVTYFGVEINGVKCNGEGEPEGTVKTLPLTVETGWISKKAPEEAGIDLKPAKGIYVFEFRCGGASVKVKGSVIGAITPLNVESADLKLNLFVKGGHQVPESFEGGEKDVLFSEITGIAGELPTQLKQEDVNLHNHGNASVCKIKKGKEMCKPGQIELNTVAAALPQFGRCVKQHKTGKFQDANCSMAATPGKGNFEFSPIPS